MAEYSGPVQYDGPVVSGDAQPYDGPVVRPSKYNVETGFVDPEDAATLKKAGRAIIDNPLTAIPGAVEAMVSGLGGMGESVAKGSVGLGRGGVEAAVPGGVGFKKGFEEGGQTVDDTMGAFMRRFVDPQTEVGKALANVLGLIPAGIQRNADTVFEETGSPAAGAATAAVGNLASGLLPGAKARAYEGPVIRPAPEAPPEPAARPSAPPGAPPTVEESLAAMADKMPKPKRLEDAEDRPASAVVRIGGKEYDAPNHVLAIKNAIASGAATEVRNGVTVPKMEPGDTINLFRTATGEVIDRDEAGRRYGAKRTEDMPPPRAAEPPEEPEVGKRITTHIKNLGGMNKEEASDTFGETGMRAARAMPGLFQTSKAVGAATRKGNSLSSLVHDGQMDPYLPPDMRQGKGLNGDREGEAVEWLREQIVQDLQTKDVGPYDNMVARRAAQAAMRDSGVHDIDPTADASIYQAAHEEVGVEANQDNVLDAARITRARESNPEAFERIPELLSDVDYMQRVDEINDAYKRANPEADKSVGGNLPPEEGTPPGGAGGQPPAPPRAPEPPPDEATPAPGREPLKRQARLPDEGAARKPPNAMVDAVRKVLAPSNRGPEAARMAGVMRENLGQLARDTQVAQTRLQKFGKLVDKMSDEERYAFIDAIETGKRQANPKLQPVADEMRRLLDERRVTIQRLGTGALTSFIEDYFPHIWKDPIKAKAVMSELYAQQFSKRPLTGRGSFLKQRTIPTIAEGLARKLEPVTSNPIDLTLLKLREMDKFVMGTRVMQEMKATGMAQFVKFNGAKPEGWQRIDDKVGRVLQWDPASQGFIMRGNYFAPEPAATILHNYLKPGWEGNVLYDAVRGTGNILNMAQLGFSAFHLGFTTLDAMVSKTALGVEQIARGDIAKGLSSMAQGAIPGANLATAVANVWRGEKAYRAYTNPGTGGPMLDAIVDALVKGGGRVKMDEFYNATRGGSYWNSLSNKRFIQDFTRNGVAKGAIEFFPRLVQTISAPIMEYIVPRQKLGVFSDMMRDAIEREPNMAPERMRSVAGKIWDSVDNRLGELVYDNLFWNKTLKDLSFISVRSVGWNLGTIREIGGGIGDYGKAGLDIARGRAPTMTHKMAYVAALPIVAGLYGAVIQYLYTGKGPEELKDYFFPKTGRLTKEGYPERISPPTYMKDIVEYWHQPVQTVINKMNPLVAIVDQMVKNEDFYGAQIVDRDAAPLTQFEQELTYLGKQMEPFAVRGYQRQKEEGQPGAASAASFVGFNPAPAYITRPPEVNRAIEQRRELPAIRKRMREEAKSANEDSGNR
jgi:hypothetical protein